MRDSFKKENGVLQGDITSLTLEQAKLARQTDLDSLSSRVKQLINSAGKDQVSSLALQTLEEKLINELTEKIDSSEASTKKEFESSLKRHKTDLT